MRYISTRDKKLNLDFGSIFLRGLAPDGGLFLPKEIKRYNLEELKSLSKLNYVDLGTEIISNFCPSPIILSIAVKQSPFITFELTGDVELKYTFGFSTINSSDIVTILSYLNKFNF